MTRVLLDTSVLIGAREPGDLEGAISAASLAELHFGALVATDAEERARRAQRLGVIEATFDPLPIDAAVAREWGRLTAAVAQRGGRPRGRAIDLAIAATANVHTVPLMTADVADFAIIEELVDVQAPPTHEISEHDVVVLRAPVGRWTAGTRGTVVGVRNDALLVEISDADGKTLDMIDVPAVTVDVEPRP